MQRTYKKSKKSERGVALLIALGILSLLLVMALAFATNAVISRKSAANNRSRSQAVFLAKSAANRIMGAMRHMATRASSPRTDFEVLTSSTYTANNANGDGTATAKIQDHLSGSNSLLSAVIDNKKYIPVDFLDSGSLPSWEIVFDSYNSSDPYLKDTNANIIGRAAYWGIPTTGQINLSTVLRGETDSSFATPPKKKRNWANRVGVDVRELPIIELLNNESKLTAAHRATMTGQFINENYSGKDGIDNYEDGTDMAPDYTDMPHVFTALDTMSNADKQWLRKWFSASGYNELEVYAVDPKANSSSKELSSATQYYHRFNLTRNDLKTGLGGAANVNKEAAVELLLGNDKLYDKSHTDAVKTDALPFLRMIGKDGGCSPNLEIRRKQIAANLLDYCDENNVPTSNSNDWWGSMPSYTGNEATPYINEVAAKVSALLTWTKVAGTSVTVDGTVTLNSLYVELFNMYDKVFADMKVKVSGSLNVEVSIAGATPNPQLHTFNFADKVINFANINGKSITTGQLNIADSWTVTPHVITEATLPDSTDVEVKITSITIDKMLLTDSSNVNCDFVRKLEVQNIANAIVIPATALSGTVERGYAIGFAVDDPRSNLYQNGSNGVTNWALMRSSCASGILDPATVNSGTSDTEAKFTLGGINTNCTAATSGDKEQLVDNTVSTAFIAQRPMVSPMELGAIHRDGKWETINLKDAKKFTKVNEYRPTFNYKNEEGTDYADGDGGILNQVKMTDKLYSPGKINLNQNNDTDATRKYDVFKALVFNVGVKNATYDCNNISKLGDKLANDAILLEIAKKIAPYDRVDPLLSRAQLLEQMATDNGLFNGFGNIAFGANSTDAEKEALAGKIINLTTTRVIPQDTCMFVIAAQSIKDVGGGINLTKLVDPDSNSSTTASKVTQSGVFDFQKSADDKTNVYFDEITGDAKLLITVKYDAATKKVTLQSMEFIE